MLFDIKTFLLNFFVQEPRLLQSEQIKYSVIPVKISCCGQASSFTTATWRFDSELHSQLLGNRRTGTIETRFVCI